MYKVLHCDHGYFIGCYELGETERMSEEFYDSYEACEQALLDNTWTPRPGVEDIF